MQGNSSRNRKLHLLARATRFTMLLCLGLVVQPSQAMNLLNDYGKDLSQMRAPGNHPTRSELFKANDQVRNDGFDLLIASSTRALAIRCEEGWDGPRVWQYRDAILSEVGPDQVTRHLRYEFRNLDECFKARDAMTTNRDPDCKLKIDFIGGQPKGTARYRGLDCSRAPDSGTSGVSPRSSPGPSPGQGSQPQPTQAPRVTR